MVKWISACYTGEIIPALHFNVQIQNHSECIDFFAAHVHSAENKEYGWCGRKLTVTLS